jgi:adenylyltransferase/sulfurtransferase
MNDDQLLRYSRQIMIPKIGFKGQQKLLSARVLIIGMGGLGSPVSMYLAAAGVGHLVICDFDQVEASNLQRQIVHNESRIGINKADSAKTTLSQLNSGIKITAINEQLTDKMLQQQVHLANIVIDASDNYETRFLLNQVCVEEKTPLISGAAIRLEGQVIVFDNQGDGPCYRCLYKEDADNSHTTCAENGILAPVVGIIGSIQAVEAIKMLISLGTSLTSRLLLMDAYSMEWRILKLPKDPQCPVCST